MKLRESATKIYCHIVTSAHNLLAQLKRKFTTHPSFMHACHATGHGKRPTCFELAYDCYQFLRGVNGHASTRYGRAAQ